VLKGNQTNSSSQAAMNTLITDASLEQNMPNPFSGTTTIRLHDTSKICNCTNYDNRSKRFKAIKQLNVSGGKGVVNIDATTLSFGSLQLFIDSRR
jgi:hypothetical protein